MDEAQKSENRKRSIPLLLGLLHGLILLGLFMAMLVPRLADFRLHIFGLQCLEALLGVAIGVFLLSALVSRPEGGRLLLTELLSGIVDPYGTVMVRVRTSTGYVTPARSDPTAKRVWLAMIAIFLWIGISVGAVVMSAVLARGLMWHLRRMF